MSKIGIFFADGFEEVEAFTVSDLLKRAKQEVELISINPTTRVDSSRGVRMIADKTIEEADFDSLDMIVLPGGMPGTTNLEACDRLMKKVDEFVKAGKYVAAICAAPMILGHAGYLAGRNACCSEGFEAELKGANVTFNRVEVADRIITSRGMGTAFDFGLKLVELLTDENTAEAIAHKTAYR